MLLQQIKSLIVIELLLVIGLAFYRFALAPQHRHAVDGKAVGLTLATPAVALLSGQLYVFYIYLALAVGFSGRTRAQACSYFLMMLPMTPAVPLLTVAGGVFILPWSAISSMSVGALIAVAITRARRPLNGGAYDIAALLLVLMFIYIPSRDVSLTSIARTAVGAVLGLAGPYMLLSRGVSTREDLDLCVLRLGLAAFMAAVVSGFQTTKHWVVYQSINQALHVPEGLESATLALRGGLLRTGGPIMDYSVAGVFFASMLVMLPYLKSRFRPGWFWAIYATVAGGLFVTQSRGAWIGAGVGIAVMLAYRGWVARTALFVGAAAVLQFVVIPLIGAGSKFGETLGVSGQSAETGLYRQRLLTRGLEQVRAHPLFGQDQNKLVANLPDLVQGQHIVDFVNGHLFIAMTAGIPWFIVWVVVWSLPIVGAWRYRKAKSPYGNPAEVPLAMTVPVMVAIAATSIGDRNLSWPTIALALAGPCFALARSPRAGAAGRRPARAPLVTGLPRGPEAAAQLAR